MQEMTELRPHGVRRVAPVTMTVDSDIDKIPVYQRGGSIIPRKLRLRRSSHLMTNDPYTLYAALDHELKAEGTLYVDDEATFDHKRRQDFGVATFSANWGDRVAIRNSVRVGSYDGVNVKAVGNRIVERVIVMGVPGQPSAINLKSQDVSSSTMPLEFQYNDETNVLVIRKPEVSALQEWTMEIDG